MAAFASLVGAAALFVFFALEVAAPALAASWREEPIVVWFVAAGSSIFLPLLAVGAWLLYRETGSVWPPDAAERLRLRALDGRGWLWTVGGLLAVGAASALLVAVVEAVAGEIEWAPAAMALEPLGPGRFWILAAWLPFFALNLVAEEVVWRGVVLPRQEVALGRHAWWVHGLGWLAIHATFPWPVLVTLLPTVFAVPWVVQRTGNTWSGVLLHAALGGPGFLALAFGFV